MAVINIPEKRRATFKKIAALSKEATNELFAVLANIPASVLPATFPKDISESVKLTNPSDAAEIVAALLSLFGPFATSSKTLEEFIASVITAFGQENPFPSADDCSQLRENLRKLMSAPGFGAGAKATGVLLDNERNFLMSRIVTEVRPIFSVRETEISGAVILHTLRISYVANNSRQDFFVAIDGEDLTKLIKDMERAKQKEVKVKKMLAAANVLFMGPTDDE